MTKHLLFQILFLFLHNFKSLQNKKKTGDQFKILLLYWYDKQFFDCIFQS